MSSAPGPTLIPKGEDRRADADSGGRLSELRQLLVGPEQRRLDRLQQRLDDPATRTEDLSTVVAEAIALRSQRDRVLQNSLKPIIEEALRLSVERNPHLLATSLFPIIGEAVRKAVAHALRGMVESLNQVLERSLSWESLKWRVEALRTGKSFAEIALTHSMRYRVEQVFLIHRETGLLLQHAASDKLAVQDTDLVSGMLTAVQDFVRDSFSGKTTEELETMQVGEYTVWLQHGPLALLAAVVTGTPPPELRDVFARALERVHGEFGSAMSAFSGDASQLAATRPMLRACLLGKQATFVKKPQKGLWLLVLLGIVIVGALSYVWDQNRRWTRFIERLRSEPGIMLTSYEKTWGGYSVVGMRDPLAADPDDLLRKSGVKPDKVTSRWEPYLSLDPEFALARKVLAQKQEIEKQVIRFSLNSTRVEPSEMAKIDLIQAQAISLQEFGRFRRQNISIEIYGHTDQSGAEQANVLLSKRRAEEVAKALIDRGVSPDVIRTLGVAASDPSLRGQPTYLEELDRRVTFRVVMESPQVKR
ncbi:MAG: OmpA family protein [Terriglobales bacterium]